MTAIVHFLIYFYRIIKCKVAEIFKLNLRYLGGLTHETVYLIDEDIIF